MALRQNMVFQAVVTRRIGGEYQDTTTSNEKHDTYIRVESVSGGKEEQQANVSFSAGNPPHIIDRQSFTFIPDLDGPNFIKQAYLYLKSLPEFEYAEDC